MENIFFYKKTQKDPCISCKQKKERLLQGRQEETQDYTHKKECSVCKF